MSKTKKPTGRPKKYPHPEPIDASPEEVARSSYRPSRRTNGGSGRSLAGSDGAARRQSNERDCGHKHMIPISRLSPVSPRW